MLSQIEKSILATIIYFDIFDYPLTSLELYKYLLLPKGAPIQTNLLEIKQLLETSSLLKKRIQTQQGFYFFQGRENIIVTRKERYKIAERKFLRAKKYLSLISKLPFVEMICICNSLSYSNSREQSDIDLAIFCRAKTIWLTRFLAVSLMEILGQRPSEQNLKNKICLSFYLTDDNLNLENYQSECPDIHFIYWQSQFLPIYQKQNLDFYKKNFWCKKYIPYQIQPTANARRLIRKSVKDIKGIKDKEKKPLGNYFNQLAKNYQLRILPNKLKTAAKEPNTNVLLEDNIIKLHSNDKRQEYNQKWRIKYKGLIKYYESIAENN